MERAAKEVPRSVGKFFLWNIHLMVWVEWGNSCTVGNNILHVWICRGHNLSTVQSTSLWKLQAWMPSVDIDPDLQHILISHQRAWREDTPAPYFLELLPEQTTIGWNRVLKGWVSPLQQCSYTILRSHQTGHMWINSLIKNLWDMAWNLWHRNNVLHYKETHWTA